MSTLKHVRAGFAATAMLGLLALAAPAKAQRAGGMAACRVDIATFCQGMEAGGGKRVRCLAANRDRLSPDCAAVVQARADRKAQGAGGQANGLGSGPASGPTGGLAGGGAPLPPQAGGSSSGAAGGVAASPPRLGAAAQAPPSGLGQPPLGQQSAQPAPGIGGTQRPLAKGARPMAACRADMAALCADVQSGRGARVACLRSSQDKLSPACADALAGIQSLEQAQRGACRADAGRLCGSERGPARRQCLMQNAAQLSPECQAALGQRQGATGKP